MALFTIEWVGNVTGADKYYAKTYPEGDSETYKKGAPLAYDDSEDGVVLIPLSSGVPSSQAMLGLALEDASGTSDTDQDVLIVQPGDIFSAMLSSDISTLVAPTQDNTNGELYGIQQLATAATNANGTAAAGTEFAVDTGATNWVRVIGADPRDVQRRGGGTVLPTMSAGDRVIFHFLDSIINSSGRQA